jgi:alcohol dehydrogenase class IV
MEFEFATAARIVFGWGAAAALPREVAALGQRVFVVTGRGRQRIAALLEALAAGVDLTLFQVTAEPTVGLVQEAARRAAAAGCDSVLAVGGGAALDTGKAVAALLANPGDLRERLEVVGSGRPLEAPARPMTAVPTTAGTGAEVTRNAVLRDEAAGIKVSLRSPYLLPRLALVDPALTVSLPREATLGSGMDALTQLLEGLVSRRANPLTHGLAREGLRACARSLRRVCADGGDREGREDMALAGLCGGLVLANAGLGAVHGVAGVLGGRQGAPHGLVCGALLPAVMAANLRVLEARGPAVALEGFAEAARVLTGDPGAGPRQAVAWVAALARDLGVPRLGTWGLAPGDLPALVSLSLGARSMRGNPVDLSPGELTAVLEEAM